jgi:hypothetical protein
MSCRPCGAATRGAGAAAEADWAKPEITADGDWGSSWPSSLGRYRIDMDEGPGRPALLFTDNETNAERLFGFPSASPFTKDAFDRYLVGGRREAVSGTTRDEGGRPLRLRGRRRRSAVVRSGCAATRAPYLSFDASSTDSPLASPVTPSTRPAAARSAGRARRDQAGPGRLIWSKQFYYAVRDWLHGTRSAAAVTLAALTGHISSTGT